MIGHSDHVAGELACRVRDGSIARARATLAGDVLTVLRRADARG